ncbi:MAG: right-handed parallel beta-helix repeat-containing protein [Planctomycetaceae bacterium]
MKTVRTYKSWLKKLIQFATASTLMVSASAAYSQSPTYGRTPWDGPASGAASGVIDSNQRGFGVAFRAGHIAGHTVGRRESISNIALTPYVSPVENGLLFGDSRLSMGNNGNLVWSFGSGYRHYIPELDIVVGGNGYVDYDELTGSRLKQWGVGAEILANRWEARGNAYQTYGVTSAMTGTAIDQNSVAFVGQNIQFTRINYFAEGMRGFDSEIGMLLPGDIAERFDLRLFGGGYYYEGQNIDGFAGWNSRLQADISDRVELGLNLTNDRTFNTTVSFSVALHFGGFQSQEHTQRSAIQRFADPVRRNMNVVTAETGVALPGQVATNPLTNLPFTVAHVNSNDLIGPFTGTVTDPFNSLTTGLGSGADVVFVHAGSQFNALPDNVVNLAPGQQLLGEGLITAVSGDRIVQNTLSLGGLGTIQLPGSPTFLASNQTLARPTILNSVGNAVTMNSDTQLSGFIIDSPTGHGIFANGASDIIINDVLIQNAGGSGIELLNTADTTSIRNTIIDSVVGPAFHVDGGDGRIGFTSTSTNEDPSFAAIINSSQQAVLIENMTGGSVNMTGSTIDDTGALGVLIQNNAGNVTIDNANIVGATGTGIAVLNSSGVNTFRDTIRSATTIDGSVGNSVDIQNLAAGGQVFFENLSILNRQAGGINVVNNAGRVSFNGVNSGVVIGPAAAGTSAAVSVSGSQSGGTVSFIRPLTITGSNGRGIEILSNLSGSIFAASGAVSITGSANESIAIVNDAGETNFSGGTSIASRQDIGILIQNSSGPISFQTGTNIDNAALSVESGVRIEGSQSSVSFESLAVTNAIGNPAVSLVNNVAGVLGDPLLAFTDLVITSTGADGLFGFNNSRIRVSNGTITTTGASAVDIEESGINITLEQVNSSASPDFGIRLVETNKTNGFNLFRVTGDQTQLVVGSGGLISAAGEAGVLTMNGGQTELNYMLLDDNQNGIVVMNSGLAVDDDQYMRLYNSRISRSDVRGVYALNLISLDIRDSILDDNGDDAALGRETVFSEYDERLNDDTTTVFDQWDNPFLVTMLRNTIIDNSTDAVVIGSLSGANGAHLGIDLDRNNFTLTDTTNPTTPLDPAYPINTFDSNRLRDDAIVVRWNGPTLQNYTTNTITLSGTAPQTAFDLLTLSTTDQLDLNLSGNQLLSTVTGTITGQQTGLLMRTFGQSISSITSNNFQFAGGEGRGMEFSLAASTNMSIAGNSILDATDGGAGIIFTSVAQPSTIGINNNSIVLFDVNTTGIEEGIVFNSVSGTVNLIGNQNNLIQLGNPNSQNAFIETIFFMPAGTNNGQIIVNGIQVP